MSEALKLPQRPNTLELPVSAVAINPAHSKRPEGRVRHILADTKALHQWHNNLEKLRRKDAPR